MATLGYARPPVIVVVTRGTEGLVRPWVEGLRVSAQVQIVAEVPADDVPDSDEELCKLALEAANVTPIDEILVFSSTESEHTVDDCSPSRTSACASRTYAGIDLHVTTTVTSYRASSCRTLRTRSLPVAIGSARGGTEEDDRRQALEHVLRRIHEFASSVSWTMFPTESSIQRVEDKRIVIAGPLTLGDYFLKTPYDTALKKGIRAVGVERNQTTLELDEELAPEPGDELHGVTDMITITGYTAVTGGIVRSGGTSHSVGGAAVVARSARDRMPTLFEIQFGGELIPGIDSRHVGIGVAGGLRVPSWISPYILLELGVGGVYQGSHGARAATGRAGVGAGIELRRTRWFAFTDVRVRGYTIGRYEDSESNPLKVKYTDDWRTTTAQLGFGWSFQ